MNDLEQRIADLKAQKEAMEAQDNFDVNEYNKIVNDLSEAEYELAQQQEKEQRDQKQQEVIDSSIDMLPEIFAALFPQDTFSQILGLTNYADKQQQFYQIVKAYTAEQVQKATEPYEQDLAAKDEKIRLMNKQSLEVQNQLDTISAQLQAEKDAHDKTQAELADVRAKLNTALSDSAAKDEKINELQSKLDNAQPKAQPSADLQSMIEQTKIKSQSSISVDDLIARFNARQKTDEVKLPLPEVPQIGGATFPQAQPTDNSVHNGDTAAPTAPIQPPEVTPPATFPQLPDTNNAEMANEQQGVQQEGADVAKEIEHIKARLDRLEQVANLPALEKAS